MSLMPTKLKSQIPLPPDKRRDTERVSFEGEARIAAEIDTHVGTHAIRHIQSPFDSL